MQQARAMVDIVKRYSWSYVSAIHTEGKIVILLPSLLIELALGLSHIYNIYTELSGASYTTMQQ